MVNKKVAFYTLGCKLNFSETSTMSRIFINSGFQKVEFSQKADIYVINTCSVTESADKKFKNIVKLAINNNPNAYIVSTGCYAQLKPEELLKVDGVDLVLGNKEKFDILKFIDIGKNTGNQVHACQIYENDTFVGSYSQGDRTRVFLKIQDGCDYNCSYCTIPLARGKSRSDTIENVILKMKKLITQGAKEIVLTGINIGDFGITDIGEKRRYELVDLIKEIDKLKGIRVRISSIEPNLLSDEIIHIISKSQVFMPHFHIPLQSGSDIILKKMKRKYLTSLYSDRVEKIKKLMPFACIGVDVIVGFPNETDELFIKTYDYISNLDVSYLHVFTYSQRANTKSAEMKNKVSINIRRKRNKVLSILSVDKRRKFYSKNINRTLDVLFEKENKDGFMYGFTQNYIKVKKKFNPQDINKVHKVKLDKVDNNNVFYV